MPWFSPIERSIIRERRRRLAILALLGYIVAVFLDRPVYHLFYVGEAERLSYEDHDWYQVFRCNGSLVTWLLISAAIFLAATPRSRLLRPRGEDLRCLLVIASPAIAGVVAEILKPLIGRERPVKHDGEHVFKPFLHGLWDGSNLGLPSSHAAVAFGGAFMLGFLYPRVRVLAMFVATGCVVTRLMGGAHFLSDAYVGAWIAFAVASWLRNHALPHRPTVWG